MPELNLNYLNPSGQLGPDYAPQLNPMQTREWVQKQYAAREAEQQNNMLAQLYAKHYDPQTGDVNYNSLIGEAAQNPLTARAIPDLMGQAQTQASKQQLLAQKNALEEQQRATAAAKQQEMFDTGVKNSMTYYRSQLDNITTPEEYIKLHEATHADPYLSRYFAAHGVSKEDSRADIEKTLSQPNGLQIMIDKSKKGLDSILGIKPETQTEFDKKWALFQKQYPNGTYEQFVKLSQSPGTTVKINTAEAAGTAFSKELGGKVATELSDLSTKAQAAKSSLETSQLLRPLVNNPDFISGTLGDARLAAAKVLGLPGADETQTFFAGIGRQVAENVKAFGSGTSISDADRAYAEKIAGGNIQLTAGAIKKIMDLNDKYAQLGIDKYNSRKKFLSQKNPTINEYYEDITAPSALAAGGAGSIPAAAIAHLKANPALKAEFDKKYGAGAAERVLK